VVIVRALEPVEIDTKVVATLNGLLPQLSKSAAPLTEASLAAVVCHDGNTVFVARRDDEIVGMLTLVLVRLPTGLRGHIEDVVTDENVRGAGIGRALVSAAQEAAARAGVRTLDLTSRPEREAAHRLYATTGFTIRETAVYRWIPPTAG
jgi:ribosomal protein S18 acetylase RimI-like enzyme